MEKAKFAKILMIVNEAKSMMYENKLKESDIVTYLHEISVIIDCKEVVQKEGAMTKEHPTCSLCGKATVETLRHIELTGFCNRCYKELSTEQKSIAKQAFEIVRNIAK